MEKLQNHGYGLGFVPLEWDLGLDLEHEWSGLEDQAGQTGLVWVGLGVSFVFGFGQTWKENLGQEAEH